jgi:hypothetical protein
MMKRCKKNLRPVKASDSYRIIPCGAGHDLVPAGDVVRGPKDDLGEDHSASPAASIAIGPTNDGDMRTCKSTDQR